MKMMSLIALREKTNQRVVAWTAALMTAIKDETVLYAIKLLKRLR